MDFPRTPKVGKRYGPSVGGREELSQRKRAPVGGGRGGSGFGASTSSLLSSSSASSFGFLSSQGNDLRQEVVSYEELVERALAAIAKAEARGDKQVDMEEREWEAWQQWQTEQEIEREVQRRLAIEKEKWLAENRRIVTIPTPPTLTPASSNLSAKRRSVDLTTPGGPGFLVGDRFTSISASPRSSSPGLASSAASSTSAAAPSLSRYPDLASSTSSRSRSATPRPATPPTPPSLPGALVDDGYDDDEITRLSSLNNRSTPDLIPRRPVGSSSVHRFAPREIVDTAPQPGSSYYPGVHPSLAPARARSEVDLLLDDEGEVVGRVRRGVGVPPGGFR